MEGVDESTVLWRQPTCEVFCLPSFVLVSIFYLLFVFFPKGQLSIASGYKVGAYLLSTGFYHKYLNLWIVGKFRCAFYTYIRPSYSSIA